MRLGVRDDRGSRIGLVAVLYAHCGLRCFWVFAVAANARGFTSVEMLRRLRTRIPGYAVYFRVRRRQWIEHCESRECVLIAIGNVHQLDLWGEAQS